MRVVISVLAVAGVFAVALPGYGAGNYDNPADGDAVKSGGAPHKVGRSIEDNTFKPGTPTTDPTMGGRSPFIEESSGKSGGATGKPSRTVDEQKATKSSKKTSNKAKSPVAAPTN